MKLGDVFTVGVGQYAEAPAAHDKAQARITTLTRALRDLVGALPTCDNCCGSPATTEQFNPLHESEGVFCDECDRNAKPWGRGDLEHARAIRAALRELKEPKR